MAELGRKATRIPSRADQFLALFDALPDVCLFVKDRQSRFVTGNRAWLEMHGGLAVDEVPGKTDADFQPAALAAQYVAEDRRVMKSGRPLRDQAWLVRDHAGMPRWYLCTKVPLFDAHGVVDGIAGILRPFDRAGEAPDEYRRLTPVMEHVVAHYGRRISVAHLARLADVSVSQLQRDFRRLFNITPGEYVLRMRLIMARRRLEESADAVGRIARACGFYDQSHFTRAFKAHVGLTPLAYRRQKRSGD
jgi:AraC-like DNA-binding protein